MRWRPILCGLGLTVGLVIYALAASRLGDVVPRHWAAELFYYVLAGTLWVWPAARLIRWAGRDDT